MAQFNREERLQAIVAATLRRQGLKPKKKGKKKGWITKQEIQALHRERFLHRLLTTLKEEQ
jgi:hypothetical protein